MTGPAASSRPPTLRLSAGCDAAEVRDAVQQMHRFLKEQGWPEDDLMSFDLALVEAGNNAVRYADEAGQKQPILIEAVCEEKQVEFRVHDHTLGFEWPKTIKLPPPESESGRGIYLIHKLMDWAGYFRGPGENILIMRKGRPTSTLMAAKERPTPAEDERAMTDMVEELSSCYECLSAIFRYTSEEGKTGSLKEFAQRLCHDLLQIVAAEWFVLRLVPKGDTRLVVFAASEPALELPPLVLPTDGKPKDSLELEAAVFRRSVWFDFENPLPVAGPLIKIKPGSCGLVHPIALGNQLIGTLTLGKAFPHQRPRMTGQLVFTAGQTNVINTLSDFLAMQIANARLQAEQVAQRLIRHELEIANQIQQSLLPAALPQLEGFSLAAFCRNAHEVGGDFYDVLKINEHSALLVIADVMGKGIPAALFAAMLRTLIRAAPELTPQPAALLERVNRLLFPELSGVDMFITAQLAYVDAKARKLTVAGAGHCPLVVATTAGVKTFSPEGMPLGIKQDTVFQAESVELPEKCLVLLYTDGLTDAINAGKEHFGQERLLTWLAQSAAGGGTADQIKERLAGELEKHQSLGALSDDQTFLIMAS
jgi:serine phosphatase RsbU (regulator of sigma subunit)/anti-sigma regulatory factor (Ser/Thr protein kinase)